MRDGKGGREVGCRAHDVEGQAGDVELAVLRPRVQPLGELDDEWLATLPGERARRPREQETARRGTQTGVLVAARGGRWAETARGQGRRSRGRCMGRARIGSPRRTWPSTAVSFSCSMAARACSSVENVTKPQPAAPRAPRAEAPVTQRGSQKRGRRGPGRDTHPWRRGSSCPG